VVGGGDGVVVAWWVGCGGTVGGEEGVQGARVVCSHDSYLEEKLIW